MGCKEQATGTHSPWALFSAPRMLHSRAMPPEALTPLEEILARLERLLAASPADATDLAWIEVRRGQESTEKRRRELADPTERTVLIRVRESGRVGLHHTTASNLSDLENGLREALAQARLSPPAPPPLPPDTTPLPRVAGLHDPELAEMGPARAREILQKLATRGESGRFGWAEARVAVLNSQGRRRAVEATSAWVEVSTGGLPGAGHAAAASRTLAGLGLPEVLDRARRRQAAGEVGEPTSDGPFPVVLSQEAAAALAELLNRHALTSESFHDGTSFLRDGLDEQVFHRAINLRDDATDPRGLPIPFDLTGTAKRPVDLIAEGVALTPAVDERLAQITGLPPTPHLVAPDEAIATNLFLLPGTNPDAELLRRAEGGLWIGGLERIECFDPRALRFRAIARGVRRIEAGALGQAVPDLTWEDSLRSLLLRVLGVGSELVPVATRWRLLGATTTPLLALDGVDGLRVAAG
jgi:PmbA protein